MTFNYIFITIITQKQAKPLLRRSTASNVQSFKRESNRILKERMNRNAWQQHLQESFTGLMKNVVLLERITGTNNSAGVDEK